MPAQPSRLKFSPAGTRRGAVISAPCRARSVDLPHVAAAIGAAQPSSSRGGNHRHDQPGQPRERRDGQKQGRSETSGRCAISTMARTDRAELDQSIPEAWTPRRAERYEDERVIRRPNPQLRRSDVGALRLARTAPDRRRYRARNAPLARHRRRARRRLRIASATTARAWAVGRRGDSPTGSSLRNQFAAMGERVSAQDRRREQATRRRLSFAATKAARPRTRRAELYREPSPARRVIVGRQLAAPARSLLQRSESASNSRIAHAAPPPVSSPVICSAADRSARRARTELAQ